jgi:hypothetical protein
MEQVYREELQTTILAARDKEVYSKALVYACAYWMVRDLNGLNSLVADDWICPSGPVPADSLWQPLENSFRSRMLSRLEAFINCPQGERYLPQFSQACAQLLVHLNNIWPQQKKLDHYPVFIKNTTSV